MRSPLVQAKEEDHAPERINDWIEHVEVRSDGQHSVSSDDLESRREILTNANLGAITTEETIRCIEEAIEKEDGCDVRPYDFFYEIIFFFKTGLPLGAAMVLEWGVPPIFAMIMAGQTENSRDLQAAMGYGRVFYNITTLMSMFGFLSYFNSVIPGAIGSGRADRIPHYFKRSCVLCFICLIPIFILQLFSNHIMEAIGVEEKLANMVGIYTRYMIITSVLMCLECMLESMMINLKYTKTDAMISFVTGLGVDVLCSYYFIYHYNWGIKGVCYTQIAVKASRVFLWFISFTYHGLWGTLFFSETNEKLLPWNEIQIFISLAVPTILNMFAGWLIFELQIIVLTNIPGITSAAITGGAIWIQVETTFAAMQQGWIAVANMRVVNLLGKMDPGSKKSWHILTFLSLVTVGITNIIMYFLQDDIASVVSNDHEVRYWFKKMFWILLIHSQLRIAFSLCTSPLTPMGYPWQKLAISLTAFYLLSCPICFTFALDDNIFNNLTDRIIICLGTTVIAMGLGTLIGWPVLFFKDWIEIAKFVNQRANTDKDTEEQKKEVLNSSAEKKEILLNQSTAVISHGFKINNTSQNSIFFKSEEDLPDPVI